MAQQFSLPDHCQILCRRGTLVYRRLRRSCLVWVRIYRLLLYSRLQMPAMLDFRACRSQALRKAWSAMVILGHPWPPPLVHSTSHRLLSPFGKTHSSVNLLWGCPSIHPELRGPSNRSRGRLIQPSIPLTTHPPRLRMVRLGIQQLNSNGKVFLTLFLRSCLITRGHVPHVQLSPQSRLITPLWWAPVSTPFPQTGYGNSVGPLDWSGSPSVPAIWRIVHPYHVVRRSVNNHPPPPPPPPPPGRPNRLPMSFNGPKRFQYSPSFSLPGSSTVLVTCFCTNCWFYVRIRNSGWGRTPGAITTRLFAATPPRGVCLIGKTWTWSYLTFTPPRFGFRVPRVAFSMRVPVPLRRRRFLEVLEQGALHCLWQAV
jgi:hypothetical protein